MPVDAVEQAGAEVVEHEVRTADGVRLALYHLPPPQRVWRTPVLLAAGSFSNRVLWLGTRGHGLARVLADAGFDVWIPEWRGRGGSDVPTRWTLDDWIRRDAPAAVAALPAEARASGYFWVGHSAGGVVGAAAAAHCAAVRRPLRGIVLLGSPGPAGVHGWRRWGAWLGWAAARTLPNVRLNGAVLGLGTEGEPGAFLSQWLRWNLDGAWRSPAGDEYLVGLRDVHAPVLAVAGGGDAALAPEVAVRDLAARFGSADRTVVVAGTEHGYQRNYTHPELVVSRAAREEIWPLVRHWLERRAAARPHHGELV